MSFTKRLLDGIPALFRDPLSATRAAYKRLLPFEAVTQDPDAYQAVANWTFGRAPRRALVELFPGVDAVDVTVRRAFDRDPNASLTGLEILTLGCIIRQRRPLRILEIGTFKGNTTLNLAANAPSDAKVTTVDLPSDWDGSLALPVPTSMVNVTSRDQVGRQFRDQESSGRIRQVYGDTAAMEWSDLGGPFDVIFIDGCHHAVYVENDTRNALRQINPSGLIIWHDYGIVKDVSHVVDRYALRFRVAAIRGTSLAVGFPE